MSKRSRITMTLLAGLAIAGGVAAMIARPASVSEKKGRWASGDGPVPVRVANATTADVPVFLDAVGTARALNTVAVQPQVAGKLIEVAFREGQMVQKDQVIARIDPATYQAALDQAKAKLEQDQSQLANAKLDLERYVKIPGAIPVKTVDTQRALVAQLTGQVAASEAAVDAAQLQRTYTDVVAPLTGRTGIRQIDEGNIVSTATSLVTITQLQPISVLFNLPQQNLAAVNQAAASGTTVSVDAMEADNKTQIDSGKLLVVDNQVDQTTGTVRMKAEFPNDKLQLWPGQFVNVRLLLRTLPQAVTVPTAAIQRGPQGSFVFVATAEGKVTAKVVKVAQQDDLRAVIATGVEAGERVVTSGFARLKEGSAVEVATAEELEQQQKQLPPKRERSQGKRKRDGSAADQPAQPSAQSPAQQPATSQTPSADAAAGPDGKRKGEWRHKRQDAANQSSATPAETTERQQVPAAATESDTGKAPRKQVGQSQTNPSSAQ